MGEIYYFSSSLFLGWSLGANDSANVFGTAVGSRMVKYRTAIILCAIFVVLGAYLEGAEGIKTIGNLTGQTLKTAFISSLVAAITVTYMTYLGLPVSTSQAAVGAILGIGIYNHSINLSGLTKVFICWVGTPVGAVISSILLYIVIAFFINKLHLTIFELDFLLRGGLVVAGCYGAYALGANNVANVIGVFGNVIKLKPEILALIGGLSIALGVLTYSKNVMFTVGKKLVPLDAFSAFIAILGQAITVHFYAKVGVPVSTSQAIIGAVLGIGLLKGMRTINLKTLLRIILGWIATPLISGIISYIIVLIFK